MNNKINILRRFVVTLLTVICTVGLLHYSYNSSKINESSTVAQASYHKDESTSSLANKYKQETELYFSEFISQLEDRNYQASLAIYQRCLADDPKVYAKLRGFLLEYIANSSLEAAIEILEIYVSGNNNDVDFVIKLAERYQAAGDSYKAIHLYLTTDIRTLEWIRICDKKVYQLAHHIYTNNSNDEELFDLFQVLIYRQPNCSFYRFAIANLYLKHGYLEEAKSELLLITDNNKYGRKATELLRSIVSVSENKADNQITTSIPLFKYGNHFVVSASTSGVNVQLLIDTGTTFTVLSSESLAKIKAKQGLVKIGTVNLLTANGEIKSNLYRIKQFFLGNYVINDLDVAESETNIDGIDGLLGMNVLGKYNFFIDQSDNLLSLNPK